MLSILNILNKKAYNKSWSMYMLDLEKLSEEISKLTILEAATLVKNLEKKLGITAKSINII